MNWPHKAGEGYFSLMDSDRSVDRTKHIDAVLRAETVKDSPFVSLAYANLVVFTALLFSLAGLDPYAAVKYAFCAFAFLFLTGFGTWILNRRARQERAASFAVGGYIVNELALNSVLVFDFFAPDRADSFVTIVTVASMSFLSVPLFARLLKPFILMKLGVIGLCCAYVVATPLSGVGTSITLAVLIIAFLLIAAIGYWIIIRRHAEVRLRLELTRMHKETEIARDQATADFDLRQRLLSYIGHDLRQPISAARFVLHELKTKVTKSEERKLVGDVNECVQSAGRMIEDIVQITHYNSPNIEILPEQIEIEQILKQIVREYRASAEASGCELRYVPSSIELEFDPVLLTRILRNLTRNAIKHAGAQDVVLGVRHRSLGIEIWVVDNGRGIATNQLHSDSSGLGLGLEISKQLARACGAELVFVSTVGKGTNCQLIIPNKSV